MGLASDISTLEAQEGSGQDVSAKLAIAYAEMCVRKNSKRLVLTFFANLQTVMEKAGRYAELIEANGGVDPAQMGVWDCQAAVEKWLSG